MKTYYETDHGKLYKGNALDVLMALPGRSVNCCVTSPPYWGLRDYGVDGQIGLEATPEQYVEKLVAVFEEVRRVLTDDGTCWVNMGDCYISNSKSDYGDPKYAGGRDRIDNQNRKHIEGLRPKNIVGQPWRVAFALQASGWYLRQDIIWNKPNPMPESVKDRCTKAHEYIFLLSKSPRYYYDLEAIKEPVTGNAHSRGSGVNPKAAKAPNGWDTSKGNGGHGVIHKDGRSRGTTYKPRPRQNESFSSAVRWMVDKRNRRSVWSVQTKPFPQAHFATFPPALIEPCILAGCPKGGVVLDPFIGSGTTAIVAHKHDCKFIGIELNQTYLDEIAIPRIEYETAQLKLFVS